ncbi:MAG: DUF2065 domain-containing protein [Smithellaceae bacterium]
MELFLCVLGMVFIIEGLPYLVFPDKLKTYMTRITALPDSTLRYLGIAAVATGLIILYFGRR